MNKNKIGHVVKSIDFNKSFFIQEKVIERNKNEVKIKFGNKNIFQKITNNLFVEINYRQGSLQHSYFSFSSIASQSTPAIFYFMCPDFLKNAKCKIDVNVSSSVYFSKIVSQNISKTINTLSDFSESNSNQNEIYVSEDYIPPQKTTGKWQGEGFSDIPEPQKENKIETSIFVEADEEEYGHFHYYKMVGQSSTTIFSIKVYHSHNFSLDAHDHEIYFSDHQHIFSPHIHKITNYEHNHNINLNHSHNFENNIYFSNKSGSLSKILLDNVDYSNKSKININSGKHTLKIYVTNISNIKCNIEIIGNYI